MNWKSIFIISILITSCQGNEEMNDPKKRNEKWCWWVDAETDKGKWIPISDQGNVTDGEFTTFYFNGNVRTQGTLKDKELNDTNKVFDLKGKLINYKIYKKDTIINYYLNDGLYKYHFPSGKIMVEGVVENHKQGHVWNQYCENGNLEMTIETHGGIKNEKWYYKNGILKSSYRKKNDKYHGVNKSYYENGKLLVNTFFVNGKRDGEYYSYYENGQLREFKTYNNGFKSGKCEQYYINGNLKSIKYYTNDTIHGTEVFYYESGGIKKIGSVVKGKFEGEWKEYSENGKLKQTCVFKDNEPQGIKKHP